MHRAVAVASPRLIEEAARFGPDGSLVGIVTRPKPTTPAWRPASPETRDALPLAKSGLAGVVFLNAGLIHRVGPNRVYVRMARILAQHGIASLRFDLSGVGDSPTGSDPDVLRRWVAETRHAIDHLEGEAGVDEFILVGNCSGAALAYLTAREDSRVHAAALVNPQPNGNLRYYLRLARTQPNFWRRAVRGGSNYALAAARLKRRRRRHESTAAEKSGADFDVLVRRGCGLLLVSCEWDASYDGFYRPLQRKRANGDRDSAIDFALVPGANHDFSTIASQDRLVETVCGWVKNVADSGAPR